MTHEIARLTVSPRLSAWDAGRREEAMQALEAGALRSLEFEAIVFRGGANRNHLRIRTADMEAFAASFVGVPFLRDHRIESVEARAGTVVQSALVQGVGNRALGKTAALAIRQTIRLTTQRDIRSFLEGQLDRFSVAWYYDGVRCSVCSREWGECQHKPGRAYAREHRRGAGAEQANRVRCELVFENPRGKEVSAVNAPAVEGTGVLHSDQDAVNGDPRAANSPPVQHAPRNSGALNTGSPARTGARNHRPQGDNSTKEKMMTARGRTAQGMAAGAPAGVLAAGGGNGNGVAGNGAAGNGGAHLAHFDSPAGGVLGAGVLGSGVLGAGGYGAQEGYGAGEYGAQEEFGTQASASPNDAWLAALRTQVVDGMLARSGLSAGGMGAVRTALGTDGALTPQRVQEVIEAQRTAESALRGGGGAALNHGRGVVHGLLPTVASGITSVRSAEEEVQSALNWLLGDTHTATPSPHLRNLRDIYLAVTGDVNFWGVFNPDYARLQSANSGTLAGMAVNALNKAVLLHYDNLITYRWYEPIVHVLPHDGSTQPLQLIHMDGIAALPAVAEGAAYTESTTGDSKETAPFGKYGAYVGITLEMIRRSEIARIQAIPRLLVQAAIRRRSATVAAVFTGNPTLADDGVTLFHANHGNSDTAAFSAAAWEAARTRIFEQPVPGTGKPLALWPTYCLTPIELYDDALTAFGYGSGDVGKPNSGGSAQEANVYATSRPGDPRPIPIVVPEWSDATDWAYIVDPRLHPVLVMAYANATAGGSHALPEIFEVRSESAGLLFSNDVLPVKIRDWWAFGVATHVGVGRNAVAGG